MPRKSDKERTGVDFALTMCTVPEPYRGCILRWLPVHCYLRLRLLRLQVSEAIIRYLIIVRLILDAFCAVWDH